jgi:hypothetical protein
MVSDGSLESNTATVTIEVSFVNHAPVAHDDVGFTSLQQPVLVHVLSNDTDVDGDSLLISAYTQGSYGSVTIANSNHDVIYTPNSGFNGDDQFTYQVSDGNGGFATGTVRIHVYNLVVGQLAPPVGGGGTHEFQQGDTASIRLKIYDANGNEVPDLTVYLKVQLLSPPGSGIEDPSAAGNSNTDNQFSYVNNWYQYNLKTDKVPTGTWALYVLVVQDGNLVLLDGPPIDGISATIIVK